MRKNKLLLLLVLLMAVSGAWAQDAVAITTDLADSYEVTVGSPITLSIEATNAKSYQWYKKREQGNSMIFRATSSSYTFIPREAGETKFFCRVRDNNNNSADSKVTTVIAAVHYSVTMAEGTDDAANWTISPAKAAEGSPVTATYSGEKKVKSVKAVKKAPKPDLLSGVFSVSESKQVNFSKGNLSYAESKWSFFDNQYDYYYSYSADAWDKFGWSTSANTYGMNTSSSSSDYSGDFVDWGATMGTGWFTLSSDEWTYLLNTRSASTVGGTDDGRYAKAKVNYVQGIILFPDTYTHPDGVAAPIGVNETDNTGWDGNNYTVEDWTKMESAGCVFLPVAGYRNGSMVSNPETVGRYWSATPRGTSSAYSVNFPSSTLSTEYSSGRYFGLSVRLVREVTE